MTGRRRSFRPNVARQGLLITAVFWLGWFAVAVLHRGTGWPHALPAVPDRQLPALSAFEAWENFWTVWLLIEAAFLAAWGIYRRSGPRDGLVWSLIAFFGAFALLFLWGFTAQLYGWPTTDWVRRIFLRWPLVVTLAAFIWQLSRIPDGPGDRAVLRYDPRRGGSRP